MIHCHREYDNTSRSETLHEAGARRAYYVAREEVLRAPGVDTVDAAGRVGGDVR